jgi:Reverse transcriptase (RNA-dependent DNA polymerase)
LKKATKKIDFSEVKPILSHISYEESKKQLQVCFKAFYKLIESYLTGRSQCVFAYGFLSSFLPVTQGVPQEPILGPLLFSLFINDISSCIQFSNYHIYADDVQIYMSGSKESIASVINQINSDLASVSHWSTENGLYLNSQKTQVMATPSFRTLLK